MIYLKDNSPIDENIYCKSEIIKELEGKTIKDILDKKANIVLFPASSLANIDEKKSCIFSEKRTRNIAGFLSSDNGEEIRIGSRFSGDKNKDDYFLNYMLKRVLNYNEIANDFSFSEKDAILDLLIFIFPNLLEKALQQGMYKEYVTKKYNDMNVKGKIDINRFIKNSIPFTGKIPYETREFSYDNNVTQLIRHTIEFIKIKKPELLAINKDVKKAVSSIISTTPTYKKFDKDKIIIENMNNEVKSPYFSNYKELQRLCLKIFGNDKMSYSKKEEDSKVRGIIIDIAWLWEEYIACIISDSSSEPGEWERYIPSKTKGLDVFVDKNYYKRYPDFVYKNIPIDAKYKKDIDEKRKDYEIDKRTDYNQIITYMYLLQSKSGGFIKPLGKDQPNVGYQYKRSYNNYNKPGYQKVGELAGYGGEMFIYNFEIPKVDNYEEFEKQIKLSEENLVSRIEEKFRK